MSDLSRAAKELVRAGRSATRPSPADHHRVLSSLRARLGDSPFVDAPSSPVSSIWARGSTLWKGTTVAVLCGLGAAAYLELRPGPELAVSTAVPTSPVAASIAPSVPPSPAVADSAVADSAVLEVQAAAPSQPPRKSDAVTRTASRVPDRLAEEVAILSRAEADLHRGQAASALRALEEHQRKFPKGTLTVERRAARARVLCSLGRAEEARAELGRLARLAPGSSLEARAREACGPAAREKR